LKAEIDSPTVEEAAARWLCEHVDHRQKRADLTRGTVDRCVIPILGARRVRDVEPVHIMKAVRDHRDKVAKGPRHGAGGLAAARSLLVVLKGMFRYCVESGWLDRSPAAQVSAAAIGPAQASRDRVLTDDEIRSVMADQHPSGSVLRFLLLTGLRIGEAYGGHREGLWWVVPKNVAKNGREHRVWLSRLALVELESHPWAAARTSVQHRLTHNAPGWTAHDLRRTFATRLNAMGVAPYVVERCLNHTFSGVMEVYNRADYHAERIDALERWSRDLEGKTRGLTSADMVRVEAIARAA